MGSAFHCGWAKQVILFALSHYLSLSFSFFLFSFFNDRANILLPSVDSLVNRLVDAMRFSVFIEQKYNEKLSRLCLLRQIS